MITIVPYKATWPEEFTVTGARLRQSLDCLALRIDHIGSTAVPGLAAKDILDVQITVPCLTPEIEEALRKAGYQHLPHITQDHVPPGSLADSAQWSKWFFKSPAHERTTNIHVRLQGGANQRYAILFRDYLRAHPAIAAAYAQVKQSLVSHRLDDQDAYYDIKDPVCDIIMGGAEAWATTAKWAAGVSDC